MATYIKTLKEDNGDITYPQTKAEAVLLNNNSDLETELSQYVTAEDIASTSAVTPAITTAMIADDAVTSAKLATGAVQTTNILNNTVTSSKINWTSMPYKLDVWTGTLAASTSAAVIRQVDVSAFPTGAVFGVVTAVNASGSETTTGMFINLSHSTQASPYIGNVTLWGKSANMCHIFTKAAGVNTMNIQGYKDNASAVNYNSITTIVWRIG